MNSQDIAPCGINCSLCSAFIRKKDTCPGCNGVDNKPTYCRTCQIRFCSEKTAENEFCGSCDKYPCKRMKTLHKRYSEKYGVNTYRNLEIIRKNGIGKFITEEEKKWQCSKCGNLLCMHKDKCPNCGEVNRHYIGTRKLESNIKDVYMNNFRTIKKIIVAHKTTEGAGVILNRAIGFDDPYQYDPFLLFDDFRSDNPVDFIKGFPWHPHRGIETITYVLNGDVDHEDSLGNKGKIGEGDIQWMTAGSGIYHQEMPLGDISGKMYGFQLWANLPRRSKMTNPKYRGVIAKDIPEVKKENGVFIRIIAGSYDGISGPIKDVVINPEYFDITIPQGIEYIQETTEGHRVMFYVFKGTGYIETLIGGSIKQTKVENKNMVLFEDGEKIKIVTRESNLRFLMISGKPINEPIAWYGPIVMNTEEELQIAYDELQKGTFVKAKE